MDVFIDVVFVNGCAYSVPHPIHYRVDHQIKQLITHGVSARKVETWDGQRRLGSHGARFRDFLVSLL